MSAGVDTVGQVDFDRPLKIAPLAASSVDDQGRRVFDVRLQRGETDLGCEEPTSTSGVNGSYLGPTLRAERGEGGLHAPGERLLRCACGSILPTTAPTSTGGPRSPGCALSRAS